MTTTQDGGVKEEQPNEEEQADAQRKDYNCKSQKQTKTSQCNDTINNSNQNRNFHSAIAFKEF